MTETKARYEVGKSGGARDFVTVDIETLAQPDDVLLKLLPAFDPSEVKVGNIKDPEKIAAKIAEAKASHFSDFRDKAALRAERGRVALIGVLNTAGDVAWYDQDDEATLLAHFWKHIEGVPEWQRIVGHNVIGFDLPFLRRRSWLLGVAMPVWIIGNRGYFSDRFFDTMREFGCGDREYRVSLDTLSKAFGLAGKVGSGADFGALWVEDRAKALAYCEADLRLTRTIAERMLA